MYVGTPHITKRPNLSEKIKENATNPMASTASYCKETVHKIPGPAMKLRDINPIRPFYPKRAIGFKAGKNPGTLEAIYGDGFKTRYV